MLKLSHLVLAIGVLAAPAPAVADLSIGFGSPHVSIGINLPSYPDFDVVPGYPVYYAPRVNGNFFFYDGMYWVYQDDNWYSSDWYNGPWGYVDPYEVPEFVLRVPVRYYRQPPPLFLHWRANAPPRWGDHWGHDWNQRRSGWDRWDRRSVPKAAPLPTYQRQFGGDHYPRQVEQQRHLNQQHYSYQPRDPVVRRHYQERATPRSEAPRAQPRDERNDRMQAGPERKPGRETRQEEQRKPDQGKDRGQNDRDRNDRDDRKDRDERGR